MTRPASNCNKAFQDLLETFASCAQTAIMSGYTLAVIGCGTMGFAILSGVLDWRADALNSSGDNSKAAELLFTGDVIPADVALRIGLVNESHPATEVQRRALELAGTIATRAPRSVRGAKTIINLIADGLDQPGAEIDALYDDAHTSADYQEGVRAFLDKRAPDFS